MEISSGNSKASLSRVVFSLIRWVTGLSLWLLSVKSSVAQEVKVWEFSPYQVQIWYAFEATVSLSEVARHDFIERLQSDLERTFQAAWDVRMEYLPAEIENRIWRNFNGFSLADITASELTLVLSAEHPQSKSIRTFEAALESLTEIYCSAITRQRLENQARQPQFQDNSLLAKLLAKSVVDGEGQSLNDKLSSATISAAMLPQEALLLSDAVRTLPTFLPWQASNSFREQDKLFFLMVGMRGDDFCFKVREVDCPMQYLGPAVTATTSEWSFASRVAGTAVAKAFAPVARVEDAGNRSAVLRLRAGGLITNQVNPAAVQPGDIMQPMIRRNDRNGQPALLAAIPWTFAAVTATDGVTLEANVYGYSGGPGLEGRKNRRTERIVLRVRPVYEETELQLVVRGTGRPQSGCLVYQRDLLTEQFELLGRTDWRGRLTIPVPQHQTGILPEAIRNQRFAEKQAAQAKLLIAEQEAAQQEKDAINDWPALESEAASRFAGQSEAKIGTLPATAVVPLNVPLLQLYIKSGDSVLAKLAMVPGLKPVETAELLDDTRRLQTEAFVKGFQGEVLDLIGLRKLLAARIQLHLKDSKLVEAKAALDELRRLRNYNEMTDELEAIQRRMLDETAGAISSQSKSLIDHMFQTTREMLQIYMQDNLVKSSEDAVEAAQSLMGG